jgi:hypothetical protein
VSAGDNDDSIVCPLWTSNEPQFRRRRYHAWDRACSICGRKVVVSGAVKREIDAEPTKALVCDQCALINTAVVPAESLTDSVLHPD